MQLAGGNSLAKVSASDLLPGKSNYFLGNDPSKWHSDVPHYARVSYKDVYPGVNLAFHGAQRQTEFDFVVAPGANPAPIAFRFTGAKGIKTDNSGNLVISSAAGDVQLHKPVAYQEQDGARQYRHRQTINSGACGTVFQNSGSWPKKMRAPPASSIASRSSEACICAWS